jgi:hypothetical protein
MATPRHLHDVGMHSGVRQLDLFGHPCLQQDVAAHGLDVFQVALFAATVQIPRPDARPRRLGNKLRQTGSCCPVASKLRDGPSAARGTQGSGARPSAT